MNYKVLPTQLQFTEGDALWLFPQMSSSRCLQKVDWYLNFQIMNTDIGNNLPVLVLCNNKLPTTAVMSVNFENNIEKWLTKVLAHWEDLGSPSIRIFLPDGYKAKDLNIINNTKTNINVVASL